MVGLLGGFELRCGRRVVRLPLSVQRPVAFLAMQSRPLQRPYVAGTLWLDAPEERAAANLRTAVWRARRTSAGLISRTPSLMSLGGAVEVDVSRNMRERGRAILLVSHALDQVLRLSDRMCVLRRGRQVGVRRTSETTGDELVAMITGLR